MPDITILMPCLNEEANIAYCIEQAASYIRAAGLSGEILVVDNGSTDGSAAAAEAHGARVVTEPRRGYGRALRTGLEKARGDVILFGDADSTYDFSDLDRLYRPLAENRADFITGDRFAGEMERGSMSFIHRLGVPFLSWCGRVRFHTAIHDFHCGIRAIRRDALAKLELRTNGMEFATELIAECARRGLRMAEVSVPLRVSRKTRKAKLRTFRDGLRHLRYILTAPGTGKGNSGREQPDRSEK